MTDPLLRISDLQVSFAGEEGEARAVDGVSLDVEPASTVGLVGESGCGKSVTALSVLRLLPGPAVRILPGSSVRFRGRELLALPEKRMREVRGNEIAMVFQEPMTSLNPVYPVGEQIAEAIRWHRPEERRVRGVVLDLLQRVGLEPPERAFDAYPHQLSGGMRQRAMIAVALSCGPALLIADEPTTALDVTIQAQILELLGSIQAESGLAILLITHDLGVVAEMASRVAVMYAGRIVEEGAVGDVLRAPGHPYTQGLLAAIPDVDDPAARPRGIPGSVPRPTAWPEGCRFHPRCPHVWARCRSEVPRMAPTGRTRSRCFLAEEPERRVVDRDAGRGGG
ncbi:MAG: ABC transporter ATP-binding protein [Gemmatimonadota bacterium]